MTDFEHFAGECPYCEQLFDDEDDWFEHTSCCEQDQPEFPSPEDEE